LHKQQYKCNTNKTNVSSFTEVLIEINNMGLLINWRHARSGPFPYPYSANAADGPNVLTGEHEMLYLIGRCAAGTI